ncbi:MAG TPA: VWA domain-containing protein [Bryobacteraceae bacterium]|nr:VWA domain-containing protein [Bryobacteraceae bacterium]
MRSKTLIQLALGLLIAVAGYSSQRPSEPYTISTNVDVVLLDASVKDPRGGYVTGLPKSAFHVTENGRSRPISLFANVDAPVTLGLVIDNSGSMRNKRAEVVLAGLAFAKESNSKDEFFVINFNDSVAKGLPPSLTFTDDLQTLRAALFYGRPLGKTALYDATASALKHLEKGHHDKRTLIVVSDGGDNASKIPQQELMALIESSRATIYTVELGEKDDPDLKPGVLRKIAAISGGQYYRLENLDDVIPVFKKISKDIRSRYTIGYIPNGEEDKRRVRSIRVTAQSEGRKLAVKSRTSYMISPAAN